MAATCEWCCWQRRMGSGRCWRQRRGERRQEKQRREQLRQEKRRRTGSKALVECRLSRRAQGRQAAATAQLWMLL